MHPLWCLLSPHFKLQRNEVPVPWSCSVCYQSSCGNYLGYGVEADVRTTNASCIISSLRRQLCIHPLSIDKEPRTLHSCIIGLHKSKQQPTMKLAIFTSLVCTSVAFAPAIIFNQHQRTTTPSALNVAVDTSDIKNGLTIELDGEPYKVLSFSIMKQARGAAKTTIKFKNLRPGTTIENTYRCTWQLFLWCEAV